ncbi:zinc-ribbon domain-containing protein [Methanobrevibacter sp. V74]|uniref:zinc-ribbon domain-containing protein n=1 Tax=Methanobrevibacter sp. V74 TaxID=3064279 RepID=UPI0027374C74|nr:zinc-ribbon domain-containing protein [Methanobrevibacter sp. V74]
MDIIRHCPNCGFEVDEDTEFCSECGFDLNNKIPSHEHIKEDKSFFDNLNERTNFSIIVFSFVIFGVFLFAGSFVWSSFMEKGSIDFITYLLLTIVFSVFFGAIFVGYYGCRDKSYVVPNFSVYLGSIFAVVSCGIGLIFTFLMGIFSLLSHVFSSGGSNLYGSTYQSTTPTYAPSIDLSGVFKIILFILLIPVAAYLGVYLGYILKENL